jgi:hypothetical protein
MDFIWWFHMKFVRLLVHPGKTPPQNLPNPFPSRVKKHLFIWLQVIFEVLLKGPSLTIDMFHSLKYVIRPCVDKKPNVTNRWFRSSPQPNASMFVMFRFIVERRSESILTLWNHERTTTAKNMGILKYQQTSYHKLWKRLAPGMPGRSYQTKPALPSGMLKYLSWL